MDPSHGQFFGEFDLKYLYIFASGLLTVAMAAKDRYNQPTFSKSKLVPFIQLPPARHLTTDSRYRNGLIIYMGLMLGLYAAMCWVGPSILADPRIGDAIDPKYKDAALWPIGVAALLATSTAVDDKRWIGKLEYFARQYAQKVAYIPAAVTDLAYSLRNMPITLGSLSGELAQLRETFLRDVLGSHEYDQNIVTPPQEGAFANWIRANICFHSLTLLSEERIALRSDRSDVISRDENKEIFDRIKTHHEALRVKCPPGEPQKANQNFEEIQTLLKESSLLLASIVSQMSRNPKELRDCLQSLGFGEEIGLDDAGNWGTYVTLVVMAIAVGAILSFIVLYLMAVRSFAGLNSQMLYNGQIFSTAVSAFILYTTVFLIGENLRDKWLSSGDWEEALGCYVKHIISTALWSALVAAVLIGVVNALMGQGQGLTVLLPVGINSLLAGALASGFFLIHCYQSAQRSPLRITFMAANPYAIAHAMLAAGMLVLLQIMVFDVTARSGTSQAVAAAKQNFSQVAKIMKGEVIPANNWFIKTYTTAEIEGMAGTLDELANNWATQSKAWGETTIMTEVSVVDKRLEDLGTFCGKLNEMLKNEKKLFVVGECRVLSERLQESDAISDAAKKSGDTQAVAAIKPYMAIGTGLASASDSLQNYRNLAGSSIKRQITLFTGLTTLIVAYLFGIGCRSARSWLLIEHRKGHRRGFAKLRDELGRTRGQGAAVSDDEFEKFLRTPIDALGRMPPMEAMRYEDYRAKLFTLIDNRVITLLQPQP